MLFSLDDYVLRLTGTIAGRRAFFDKFIVRFLDLSSVKLLPLIAILIYIWFSEDNKKYSRSAVVEATASMFSAVAASRLIQNFSPLRLRPLHSGNPAFIAPIGTNTASLEDWSSFPSDHAALTFALSTAVWRFSRPLGTLSYVWSLSIVGLPRIYAGRHYASDVLAGAMIGIAAAVCMRRLLPTEAITRQANDLATRYPGLFNAALFILMFFFATMFDDIRVAFRWLFKEV